MLDKNKIGLSLGLVISGIHALWALAVAVVPAGLQSVLDFIFRMHFIEPIYKLTAFNIVNALMLIVMTFCVGYVVGWAFAYVHILVHKKK